MERRVNSHPILPIPERRKVKFYWEGKPLYGLEGDTVASALIANGIFVLGSHHKDGSPQSLFCANGQCAQCLVEIDGVARKSCITLLEEGMRVNPLRGRARVVKTADNTRFAPSFEVQETDVLIVGGGPAGLSAAKELAGRRLEVLLVDDKPRLGGKLLLQHHKFFGSSKESFAGKRGIEIAEILEKTVRSSVGVEIWTNSYVVGIFTRGEVGVVRNFSKFVKVLPKAIIIAPGAREKFLTFKGNVLPGVLGAGAFQTLLNRDLVLPGKRVIVVGAGNVGLITAYHSIQAGIEVVAVVEAAEKIGGYEVHANKLRAHGVPILTSHTLVEVGGGERVEWAKIAAVDSNFNPIPNTEECFEVDTVLLAVGLHPVEELEKMAKSFPIPYFVAGDAEEISEATAAIVGGKIAGRRVLQTLLGVPFEDENELVELKHSLGKRPTPTDNTLPRLPKNYHDLEKFPVFWCKQDIPCDPCASSCPFKSISKEGLRTPPKFSGKCVGCGSCVATCPGLAITLVERVSEKDALLTVPFELPSPPSKGSKVKLANHKGEVVGTGTVVDVKKWPNNTALIKVATDFNTAISALNIKVFEKAERIEPMESSHKAYICRCERIPVDEVEKFIVEEEVKDLNQIKEYLRVSMGACGGKTCTPLLKGLYRKLKMKYLVDFNVRPPFVETEFSTFVKEERGKE